MQVRLCIRGHGYYQSRRCPICTKAQQAIRNADPKRRAYLNPQYRRQSKRGTCHLCGREGADTRDHLVPLHEQIKRWGEVRDHRTAPAHRACNSGRGARNP
jgi:5-methylcytosine-specific restriction endonuclease McrA